MYKRQMKMYAMYSKNDTAVPPAPEECTLILNTDNNLIRKLDTLCQDDSPSDIAKAMAKQVYTLALIGQRQLSADELSDFLSNSFELLERL